MLYYAGWWRTLLLPDRGKPLAFTPTRFVWIERDVFLPSQRDIRPIHEKSDRWHKTASNTQRRTYALFRVILPGTFRMITKLFTPPTLRSVDDLSWLPAVALLQRTKISCILICACLCLSWSPCQQVSLVFCSPPCFHSLSVTAILDHVKQYALLFFTLPIYAPMRMFTLVFKKKIWFFTFPDTYREHLLFFLCLSRSGLSITLSLSLLFGHCVILLCNLCICSHLSRSCDCLVFSFLFLHPLSSSALSLIFLIIHPLLDGLFSDWFVGSSCPSCISRLCHDSQKKDDYQRHPSRIATDRLYSFPSFRLPLHSSLFNLVFSCCIHIFWRSFLVCTFYLEEEEEEEEEEILVSGVLRRLW